MYGSGTNNFGELSSLDQFVQNVDLRNDHCKPINPAKQWLKISRNSVTSVYAKSEVIMQYLF